MPTWNGEVKCLKCGHWQIPARFCPMCGFHKSAVKNYEEKNDLGAKTGAKNISGEESRLA